jgi:hypothetical protein
MFDVERSICRMQIAGGGLARLWRVRRSSVSSIDQTGCFTASGLADT